MNAMRKVEKLINEFQNEVRLNIYKKELETYHQIGENRLN